MREVGYDLFSIGDHMGKLVPGKAAEHLPGGRRVYPAILTRECKGGPAAMDELLDFPFIEPAHRILTLLRAIGLRKNQPASGSEQTVPHREDFFPLRWCYETED